MKRVGITFIISFFSLIYCNQVFSQIALWEQTNGPFGGNIQSFAIDSNEVIFAGTERGGIYRSSDNGASWERKGLRDKIISTIAVDSAGTILAGVSSEDIIYSSTDNGDSWMQKSVNVPANSLIINSEGHLFSCGPAAGVFRSTNGGNNWSPVNNGLENLIATVLGINSEGYIFAGLDNIGGEAVFRSTNNGNSWEGMGITNAFITSLAVSESDFVFVGGAPFGVIRSTDDGVSWMQVNNGLTGGLVWAFGFSPGITYAGTTGGLFLSSDGGVNWNPSSLTKLSVRSILTKPGDFVLSGVDAAGVYRTTDNGNNWVQVNFGIINTFIWDITTGPGNVIYTAVGDAGVFRSDDNGGNWVDIGNALGVFSASSIVVNSNSHIFLGTSQNGIFRTTDNGASWTNVINNQLDVQSIVINSNGDIYMGALQGRVYKSSDNGDNWVQIDNGLQGAVYSVAVNPSGELFAGTINGMYRSTNDGANWILTSLTTSNIYSILFNSSGHILAGSVGGGVFRSTNNGDNWSQVNNGLNNLIIYDLVSNSSGDVFASIRGGVFKTQDFGNTWTPFGGVFHINTAIGRMAVNSNDFIFRGSQGSGIFRTSSTTGLSSVSLNVALSIALFQNYPNPFNPSTKIRFDIPQGIHKGELKVKLIVFDILGRNNLVLVNGFLNPGSYEYVFDASELPSGIYFYSLEAGEFSKMKKMVLLK